MDVDSLAKSKGKGKDSKGKGKDGWSKGKGKGKKGKGKGGKDRGKGSWNQNQNGKGWNSNQWNQNNWNQQWNNNKGKGKDKGGKSKHGDKRVAAVQNSEAEGSSQTPHQPEPEITALFALEEMAERSSRRSEHHHRSRSARTTGGRIPGGDVSEKDLMDRLEKIQHQMNRSAIHGLNVDQELVDAQQAIYAQLREMRSKALDQEAMARRAASAPAARDSRLQQDLDDRVCIQGQPRKLKKIVLELWNIKDDWLKRRQPKMNSKPSPGACIEVPKEKIDPKINIRALGDIELAKIDLRERENNCRRKRTNLRSRKKKL